MSEVKDVKATEVKEPKQPSKTDTYKQHLQKIIYNQLGVKVSKDKAWGLFKDIIAGTVEFTLKQEDKKLPLAGVGTFEIMETKPRGSKAGLDKEGNPIEGAEAWPCVPRFKFYPSSITDKIVEHAYGLGGHEDIEEKHYGIYAPEAVVEEKSEKAENKADVKEEAAPAESDDAADLPGLDDL